MAPKTLAQQPETTDQPAAAPEVATAPAAPSAPSEMPDPGGFFVNVGSGRLEIPFTGIPAAPSADVKPGRVVELASAPTHRDLRPATAADIAASRAAEEAEIEAAANAAVTTFGQES